MQSVISKTPTSGFLVGAAAGASWSPPFVMEGSAKGAAVASATGGGFDATTDSAVRGLMTAEFRKGLGSVLIAPARHGRSSRRAKAATPVARSEGRTA